jgi:hypothetical protein
MPLPFLILTSTKSLSYLTQKRLPILILDVTPQTSGLKVRFKLDVNLKITLLLTLMSLLAAIGNLMLWIFVRIGRSPKWILC